MEFVVEMLVTAFALGGVLGAVVALHLSASLKHTGQAHEPANLELPHKDDSTKLKPAPVNLTARRAAGGQRRRR